MSVELRVEHLGKIDLLSEDAFWEISPLVSIGANTVCFN